MPGTKAGGAKTAATIRRKYGLNYFKIIGAMGGANGHTGGFATKQPCTCDYFVWAHIKAECAGGRGGTISRRGKANG